MVTIRLFQEKIKLVPKNYFIEFVLFRGYVPNVLVVFPDHKLAVVTDSARELAVQTGSWDTIEGDIQIKNNYYVVNLEEEKECSAEDLSKE